MSDHNTRVHEFDSQQAEKDSVHHYDFTSPSVLKEGKDGSSTKHYKALSWSQHFQEVLRQGSKSGEITQDLTSREIVIVRRHMNESNCSGFDQVDPGEDGRQLCLLDYTTEGEGRTTMLVRRRDGAGGPAAFSVRVCARLKGTVLQRMTLDDPDAQVMIPPDRASTLVASSIPHEPAMSERLDIDFANFIGEGGRSDLWTYDIPLVPQRVNLPGPLSLYMTDLPEDTVVKASAEFEVELGVEGDEGSMDVQA